MYLFICVVLHFLCPVLSRLLVPGFPNLPHSQRLQWYNRATSMIHAINMSALTAYYWLQINPNFEFPSHISPYESRLNDIMVGYLIYDILYEAFYSRQEETVAHHMLGLIVHIVTRITNSGIATYYLMMVYLAEFSTPLLHATWLLYHLVGTKSTIYRVSQSLLLIIFFLCRVVLGPCMLAHMIHNRKLWGPRGYFCYFNIFVCGLFVALNFKWFYGLVNLAIRPAAVSLQQDTDLDRADKKDD